MTAELNTPRTQGRDAYRSGVSVADNPYDWHYAQTAWAEGWLAELVASAGTTRHCYSLGVQARNGRWRRVLMVWSESMTHAMKLGTERIMSTERILSAAYVESRDEPAMFTSAAEIAEGARA